MPRFEEAATALDLDILVFGHLPHRGHASDFVPSSTSRVTCKRACGIPIQERDVGSLEGCRCVHSVPITNPSIDHGTTSSPPVEKVLQIW